MFKKPIHKVKTKHLIRALVKLITSSGHGISPSDEALEQIEVILVELTRRFS